MSGLVKTCKICNKSFTTMSMKRTEFEERCASCYNTKKRTTAEKNIVGKLDRAVMSIETRLDRLEKSQEMIPMIIGAEISTMLMDINGLSGIDLKGMISLEMAKAKEEMLANNLLLLKNNQSKFQSQIMTLNNKIVKLMREMEK